MSHPVWEQSSTAPTRHSLLHSKVAWAAWGHASVESILLGEALTLDIFELLRCLCQIIHFKAKMVNATVVGPIRTHVSIFLSLPVQDGQIDVPICEEHRTVRAAPDLFQPESLFVKSRCLVGILSGQGNVLDLRHNCALLCSVLGLMAATIPQPRDNHAILRGARARVNDKCPKAMYGAVPYTIIPGMD